MKANTTCRGCGVELNEENWYVSQRKRNNHICKECQKTQTRFWQERNPEKIKANHKHGGYLFNENKECSMFLGVHIAERVLSHTFKNVERMPMNNPGYDFVCNRGKKIDVKSSCQHNTGEWLFHIAHNTTADFFLCLAFDNREDLNPLHAWLIPGSKVSHLLGATTTTSKIHKWDEYRLDISKINTCCDAMR